MSPPTQVRAVIDLDAYGEPIQGSISIANERSQRFFGWLELAGQLEQARTFAREDPAAAGPPTPGV